MLKLTHVKQQIRSAGTAWPSRVKVGTKLRRSRRSRRLERASVASRIALVQPQIKLVHRPGLGGPLKRGMDLALASALLVLLSPLMLAIAVAIKINSPGPVLFSHYRVGRGGRIFRFYKFRSMISNAEALKLELRSYNEKDGPIFKMRADPRITRVGRFLRRYSLDELPQIFNVLLNDMSLVGPRPPVPEEVFHYESWQLQRLGVKPGLTCTWQISGRSRLSFAEWMQMDLAYIEAWSLRLDLLLLLKTVKVVLSGDGAY